MNQGLGVENWRSFLSEAAPEGDWLTAVRGEICAVNVDESAVPSADSDGESASRSLADKLFARPKLVRGPKRARSRNSRRVYCGAASLAPSLSCARAVVTEESR